MASVNEVAGGTLGSINVGAANANIFLPALSAQLDAMIGSGLGPLKFDTAVQFNGALAAQATLLIQVGNPLSALQLAIAALAQLQAALTLALSLPPVQIGISAELGATAALAAALSAKLGLIEGLISAALGVKLPAVKFSDGLGTALGVGPAILLAFDGISDGTTLSQIGTLIQSKFAAGVNFGPDTINPGDFTSGVVIVTTVSPVFTALATLFAGV